MSHPDDQTEDARPAMHPRELVSQISEAAGSFLGFLPEESYDRVTRTAAAALRVPAAIVSIVEQGRHIVVSCVGLPGRAKAWRAAPVALHASRRALAEGVPVLVGDVRADEAALQALGAALLQEMPAGVAAAAVPFHLDHAAARGVICVIGAEPRTWGAREVALLEDFAAMIRTEIMLRRDVVLRRETQEALLHSTLHDELTGLPNRTYFSDRLRHAVRRAQKEQGYLFAVLFLDLDRFKVVNDSLGHYAGDELLVAVAHRLSSAVRPEDTVARLGGDEFAVFLESITEAADATIVAERIQAELSAPVDLGGYEVFTSASIGIVLGATGADRPEYLLRNADMAMYRAKAAGRATYATFDRAMHRDALARLQTETDLRRALEREELRLHFQPVIELETGCASSVEALLRWDHPERGLVPPGEFVGVAEDTGLILPIGTWVLREACRQALDWADQGSGVPAVAVNLSARQFAQPGLAAEIAQVLEETGLPARRLQLEVTETVIIEHTESAAAILTSLKALGVRVHLDDFGTGYSSLSYLHQLPLDAIKVDRAFVSRMDREDKARQLVQTVLTLAESIGLIAIAEGVASTTQLAELKRLGCRFAQGYLFSEPLPASEILELLSEQPRW